MRQPVHFRYNVFHLAHSGALRYIGLSIRWFSHRAHAIICVYEVFALCYLSQISLLRYGFSDFVDTFLFLFPSILQTTTEISSIDINHTCLYQNVKGSLTFIYAEELEYKLTYLVIPAMWKIVQLLYTYCP